MLAWTFAFFSLIIAGLGVALHMVFNENLKSVDIDSPSGGGRFGKQSDGSQYVLILGSDARSGANGPLAGGALDTARSDVIMVAHIRKGSPKATIVSIPRDTLTHIPSCVDSEGRKIKPRNRALINSAYQMGGPPCAVRTVEHMIGVRMDHFIGIDLAGLAKLVDMLGGVDIAVHDPIKDQASGLNIPAGVSRLNGTQSVAFVRTRHGIGDGSDLARIALQQKFLLSILKEVSDQGVITNPIKLYRIIDAATKALTVDSGLASTSSLTRLAQSFGKVDAQDTETVMLPVLPDAEDDEKIVVDQKQATALWAALKEGRRIPAVVRGFAP
ncbi:LCP family protein [Streptomyces sp. MS2.AVA.5]|uniref:LCP family protein n=1 Tax=Streptomyces achmelvichensis TaxID=3134111 RepID=A0ACC6PKV9_9ACTN